MPTGLNASEPGRMISDGYGFLFVFIAGWATCWLWVNRDALGDWIEDFLDSLLSDPSPARPIGPARSHVHLVGGDDDGGEAA